MGKANIKHVISRVMDAPKNYDKGLEVCAWISSTAWMIQEELLVKGYLNRREIGIGQVNMGRKTYK